MAVEPESATGGLTPGTPDLRRTVPDRSVTVYRWDPVTNITTPVVLAVAVVEVIPDLSDHRGSLSPAVESDLDAMTNYIQRLGAEADQDPNSDAARRFARLRARAEEAGAPLGLGEFLGTLAAPLETDQDSTT